MKPPHHNVRVLTLAAMLMGMSAVGQVGPDEHAKHHPQPGTANPEGVAPGGGMGEPMKEREMGMGGAMRGNQPGAGGGPGPGGMAGGMGEMMKKMGTPPPKELYPLLMDVPDLPPEQRGEIEQLAHERMKAGAALLSSGLEKLAESTANDDYSAMQQATGQMRQGLAQFESGLAAHRALIEGKVTRNVALQWFKREMNLASPIRPDEPRAVLGVSPFHLFTMGLLIAFAFAMVVMYFFKMRRAAALFGRLDPDTKQPPPGRHRRLPECPDRPRRWRRQPERLRRSQRHRHRQQHRSQPNRHRGRMLRSGGHCGLPLQPWRLHCCWAQDHRHRPQYGPLRPRRRPL